MGYGRTQRQHWSDCWQQGVRGYKEIWLSPVHRFPSSGFFFLSVFTFIPQVHAVELMSFGVLDHLQMACLVSPLPLVHTDERMSFVYVIITNGLLAWFWSWIWII